MKWVITGVQEDEKPLLAEMGIQVIKPYRKIEGLEWTPKYVCSVPQEWDMGAGNTPLDPYWGHWTWSPYPVLDERTTAEDR